MTSDLAHDFAERLHTLKAERDLTVREMAERCGLGKKRMENYLSRHAPTQPGLDALAAIAVGLQVAPNWLVLGIGSPDIRKASPDRTPGSIRGGIMTPDRGQIDLDDDLNGSGS
ncbi:helix-turn-helix domain-containing protein [Oricola sp.]|uniref:helix-turn-helix domain-containing protein n=1 Tax=Oricola sp. TaxID=1979950 RepID=UPI0025FE66DD|nr:helix-turn-helix domain-containing protein [Oricola sp.]MCI5075584.1 helix-turn-helix domain-containing protein [Oricola sp.]